MIKDLTIVKTKIEKNRLRIWGTFWLSDKSKTKFEMTKKNREKNGEGSRYQWNNYTYNLCITTERVKKLCEEWYQNEIL